MNLETIVRTAITPIRLSPHGVTLPFLGGMEMYTTFDSSGFPFFCIGGGLTILFGISSYAEGLSAYIKTIRNIKKYGDLDERSVHNYLEHYCSRQAARTAAINHNLVEQFDQHLATYTEKMEYKSLPLL